MWRAYRQRAGPCPLSFEIRRSGWHLRIYISHKFPDAAAAAVLGSIILWEVMENEDNKVSTAQITKDSARLRHLDISLKL